MNDAILFKSLFQSQLFGVGSIFKEICYYSKNVDSDYIDCNESTAIKLNLASLNDIKGKSDADFGWSKPRIKFLRQHDLEVMNNGVMTCKLEKPFAISDEKSMQLLSCKMPLYINEKLAGITGISIDVTSLNLFQQDKSTEFMVFLRDKFSNRESQILFHLVRGKSAREISLHLGISKRTVESYINNIKNKANVSSKSELIEKIIGDYI